MRGEPAAKKGIPGAQRITSFFSSQHHMDFCDKVRVIKLLPSQFAEITKLHERTIY